MADSTSPILQIAEGQDNKEGTANANFDAASQAMIYGRNADTSAGLVFGYFGGRYSSGAIANGTVTVGASVTTYVVAARSNGAVSSSTATTNWDDSTNYLRLYKLVSGASSITSYEDHREFINTAPPTAFTGGTLTSALNEAPTVTIASAATVNIGAAAGNTISVTGTTTITAFDTIAAGAVRRVVFAAALTLTHNGTSLILPTGANITTAAGDAAEFLSLGSGNWRCTNYHRADGSALYASAATKIIQLAASDETTALTTGTAKITFRMPHAMTVSAVRASLSTAQTSGSIFTVDINEAGTTILSTKLTIDNTEKTSTTAATAAVISDTSLADDAEISVDIDSLGDGTAKGLKITLIGT